MRRSGNREENKRIIMDLDVVLKSHDCPFIVQCIGCFITSVSKLYSSFLFTAVHCVSNRSNMNNSSNVTGMGKEETVGRKNISCHLGELYCFFP